MRRTRTYQEIFPTLEVFHIFVIQNLVITQDPDLVLGLLEAPDLVLAHQAQNLDLDLVQRILEVTKEVKKEEMPVKADQDPGLLGESSLEFTKLAIVREDTRNDPVKKIKKEEVQAAVRAEVLAKIVKAKGVPLSPLKRNLKIKAQRYHAIFKFESEF